MTPINGCRVAQKEHQQQAAVGQIKEIRKVEEEEQGQIEEGVVLLCFSFKYIFQFKFHFSLPLRPPLSHFLHRKS